MCGCEFSVRIRMPYACVSICMCVLSVYCVSIVLVIAIDSTSVHFKTMEMKKNMLVSLFALGFLLSYSNSRNSVHDVNPEVTMVLGMDFILFSLYVSVFLLFL